MHRTPKAFNSAARGKIQRALASYIAALDMRLGSKLGRVKRIASNRRMAETETPVEVTM